MLRQNLVKWSNCSRWAPTAILQLQPPEGCDHKRAPPSQGSQTTPRCLFSFSLPCAGTTGARPQTAEPPTARETSAPGRSRRGATQLLPTVPGPAPSWAPRHLRARAPTPLHRNAPKETDASAPPGAATTAAAGGPGTGRTRVDDEGLGLIRWAVGSMRDRWRRSLVGVGVLLTSRSTCSPGLPFPAFRL